MVFALSYNWGPPEPHRVIELNGKSFEIRDNLWRFLDRLSISGRDGWHWADAICINQNDNIKKSAQVPLMGQIYNCALEV